MDFWPQKAQVLRSFRGYEVLLSAVFGHGGPALCSQALEKQRPVERAFAELNF
jgi:hypothetical protein